LESARQLLLDAEALEKAGAFLLVLEAIPRQLAGQITKDLSIPTVGIGAGAECDGQVLVYHDLLGLFDRFRPKFVKEYARLADTAVQGIKAYVREVRQGEFPQLEHSFTLADEVVDKLYGKG